MIRGSRNVFLSLQMVKIHSLRHVVVYMKKNTIRDDTSG
ncbi:hypothetical protein ACHAXS_011948, partial [Conticribra weissflogii]